MVAVQMHGVLFRGVAAGARTRDPIVAVVRVGGQVLHHHLHHITLQTEGQDRRPLQLQQLQANTLSSQAHMRLSSSGVHSNHAEKP